MAWRKLAIAARRHHWRHQRRQDPYCGAIQQPRTL